MFPFDDVIMKLEKLQTFLGEMFCYDICKISIIFLHFIAYSVKRITK